MTTAADIGHAGTSGTRITSRRYFTNPRGELSAFLPAEYHTVLDVGCAEGAFASTLKSGCEVWGVEPLASVAERAKARMHRVLNGTFEAMHAQLPRHYFDLVACNDVIEHMPDHEDFLQRIQAHMKPGAYLTGSLPNVRFYDTVFDLLFRRDWRYQDMGILDRTHCRFFTVRSIVRTFETSGFTVEALRGINPVRPSRMGLRDAGRLAAVFAVSGCRADIVFRQFAFRVRLGRAG